MPVTKSDLVEQLSCTLKLPRGKAEMVVNIMFDSMVHALQQGERIEIRGFGSFEVRDYKAYEGRNPRTGDPVEVQPKRLPFFKVGKELRERVNRDTATAPDALHPERQLASATHAENDPPGDKHDAARPADDDDMVTRHRGAKSAASLSPSDYLSDG